MKQKEILMAYINNTRDYLQKDIRELQQRLRLRSDCDAIDCLELALAKERLIAFEEYVEHTMAILKLSVPEPMTYVSIDVDYAKHRIKQERNKGKE